MRVLLLFLFIISSFPLAAQDFITGRVLNAESGEALPYAQLKFPEKQPVLTNIDGSFKIEAPSKTTNLKISYVGFSSRTTPVSPSDNFLLIRLEPVAENLQTVVLTSTEEKANEIIRQAIARKKQNDPEQALPGYHYKNYNKFIIDNSGRPLQVQVDSTGQAVETIMNTARAYLSEKVSEVNFIKGSGAKETVLGLETAGFEKPVYEMLSLETNPFSLYKNDYKLFKTDYAGPLGKSAFRNYTYKILDTTDTERPAYVIYFKPKRARNVACLEGILYLDTASFAIQRAKAQLLGEIRLEVEHFYKYYPNENLWFPSRQLTTIRPGSGGKDISVFGGTLSLGSVQRKNELVARLLGKEGLDPKLYLKSESWFYEVQLESPAEIEHPSAEVQVMPEAGARTAEFWQENRQEEFSKRDEATSRAVEQIIESQDINRKLEVQKSLATGYYPVGFFDFKLGKFIKFNNYEGIRLGAGGKTNSHFSKNFSLGGYGVYGFKDKQFKYHLNTAIFLDKKIGTTMNFGYTDDIREVGSFDYLSGINDFSLLEPRFVNINYFYRYKSYTAGLERRLGSKLKTELQFKRSDISQTRNYAFQLNDKIFTEYQLAQAQLSFLWRPFSKFLRTPENNILLEKNFPKFTGQINHSFSGILDGDFNFTKFGLKIEHEIRRLDQSRTEFILEGNYATGEVPLTHLFHAYPNNPRRDEILRRFSVAGRNSFETMYYNEFFSDRLLMLHLRHQLKPFHITPDFNPELVLISRFALGDMDHIDRHQNISFDTLDKGYSEVGLELNKILFGFGLSAAYRYGAYHLPTINENFSFKFTFQLQL